RNGRTPRRPLDDVEERPTALRRGRDVQEDQLVRALTRVALGELRWIAFVDEIDEVRALDDAAVRDVEAGDHPVAEHQRPAAATKTGSRSIEEPSEPTKFASSRSPSRPLCSG